MHFIYRLLAALAAISAVISLTLACGPSEPDRESAREDPVSRDIRGFNFPSWWHDDYLSDEAMDSMDRMAATGANWVAIVPTQYMAADNADTIVPEPGGRTATNTSVVRAIDAAHENGLKVMLKPHVDVSTGSWRGDIQPDDPAAWFRDYRTMIIGYARMAEDHGVELFCVGMELTSMERTEYHDQWVDIIDDIRAVYHGELTYAASINSYESVTFWDDLDYLGLNFYYPLSDKAEASREELVAGWTEYSGVFHEEDADWLGRIEAWQERWQMPVIFTEIGYRSIDYAAREPWDYESPGVYNEEIQARAYEAVCAVMKDKPWFAGLFWWNWGVRDDSCGHGNTDYTICGKEAERTVTSLFTQDLC